MITIILDVKVAPKRWRLEINFSQDAVLMLSSMNLPDGIQVITYYVPLAYLKVISGLILFPG